MNKIMIDLFDLLTKCCQRFKWYMYLEDIKSKMHIYLRDVLKLELFGNKKVVCTYNSINDLMYLQNKLEIIKTYQINETFAEEYEYPPKTFDDEICKETTIKWFLGKGFSIRKLFTILD